MPSAQRRSSSKLPPHPAWSEATPFECSRADFAHWHPPAEGRFRGRGVVVTGGASGIGRAVAIGFALEGARVTILDVNAKKGHETVGLLRKLSAGCRFVRLDLSNTAAVRRMGALFKGRHGADVLVNNAASVGRIAPFHKLEWSECDKLLRLNLSAPLVLAQQAAQGMIAAGKKGAIINILTIQTALPVPGYSAYIASKGGLDALTLALASDLAPHGIRVNGVRVGCIWTENYFNVLPARIQKLIKAEGLAPVDRTAATLLGRMGRSVEVARAVTFLASEQASFVTGSIVRVDGGRSISRKTEVQL